MARDQILSDIFSLDRDVSIYQCSPCLQQLLMLWLSVFVGAGGPSICGLQSIQTEKMCHSLASGTSYYMKILFAALCLTCHFYLKENFVPLTSLGYLSPYITCL